MRRRGRVHGRGRHGGGPADGTYDFQFVLYDAAAAGAQIGPVIARDDVAVGGGLFTAILDFGVVFTGDKRWLDIRVRSGGSSGTYTTLSPRQELTPAPAALFSANAATIGGLSCADGQVAKWNNGWTCGADAVNPGTVTNIATGPGLTGGPIMSSGTIAVAAGGITSFMIASGAVGLAQIDQSQVQARVAGTCPAAFYLRGVNADGSASCLPLPSVPPAVRSLADVATGVASAVAVAIGPDGLPVIGYEAPGGSLRVVKCGNLSCTAGNIDSPVDDPDNLVGDHVSIAVGSDGRPVMSHYAFQLGVLKVSRCGNAACSAGNTSLIVENTDDPITNPIGFYTSLAIGTDGLAVISYLAAVAGILKVAKCGHVACR